MNQTQSGFIVQKDGLYGVTNQNGEVIIPCKYIEYADVWYEWKKTESNQEKYKSNLEELKYNSNDLLNSEKVEIAESENTGAIAEYKEPVFTKIMNWIKRNF